MSVDTDGILTALSRVSSALDRNRTFARQATPSLADVAAHVRDLSQQVSGIVLFLQGQFQTDPTEGNPQ